MLSDAIVMDIIFIISISNCYYNTEYNNFYLLTLCAVTLLNSDSLQVYINFNFLHTQCHLIMTILFLLFLIPKLFI